MALRILLIARRHVDADVAVARQEAAGESRVLVHPRMGRLGRRRTGCAGVGVRLSVGDSKGSWFLLVVW